MARRDMGARNTHVMETPSDVAKKLTGPFQPLSDNANVLIADEERAFALCEAAIETLKTAFWAAGKAMQIVRDGRLYRVLYPSFDDYCLVRWGISRDYADRLIRAWPVAERLHAIGDRKLNEAHVRELLKFSARHGLDPAATVFETVIEGPVPVTAAVIKGAVQAVPAGEFDPATAVEQIQLYLASLTDPSDDSDDGPVDLAAKAARAVPYEWLRKLAKSDAGSASRYLDEVQAQVDKARSELLTR
jgi:hypothetical protein